MATKIKNTQDEDDQDRLRKENARRTEEALTKSRILRERSKERTDEVIREKALDWIHRMEWLKNKNGVTATQRGDVVPAAAALHPIQKKELEDYFSGTAKSKPRDRKRERFEVIKHLDDLDVSAPRTVSNRSASPPRPPPPQNAWSLKPGPALFVDSTAATLVTLPVKNYDEQVLLKKALERAAQEEQFINQEAYEYYSASDLSRYDRSGTKAQTKEEPVPDYFQRGKRVAEARAKERAKMLDAAKAEKERIQTEREWIETERQRTETERQRTVTERQRTETERQPIQSHKQQMQTVVQDENLTTSSTNEPALPPRRTVRFSLDLEPGNKESTVLPDSTQDMMSRSVSFSPEKALYVNRWEAEESIEDKLPEIPEDQRQTGTSTATFVTPPPCNDLPQPNFTLPVKPKTLEKPISENSQPPKQSTHRHYTPEDFILMEKVDDPLTQDDLPIEHLFPGNEANMNPYLSYPPYPYGLGNYPLVNNALAALPPYNFPNPAAVAQTYHPSYSAVPVTASNASPQNFNLPSTVRVGEQYYQYQECSQSKENANLVLKGPMSPLPGQIPASSLPGVHLSAPSQPDQISLLQMVQGMLHLQNRLNIDPRILQLHCILNQYVLSCADGSLPAGGNLTLEDLASVMPDLPTVFQTATDDISKQPPPPKWNSMPSSVPQVEMGTVQPAYRTDFPNYVSSPLSGQVDYIQNCAPQQQFAKNFVRTSSGRGQGAAQTQN